MKNRHISVRFSEKEYQEIARNAELLKCTSSDYIRFCVKAATAANYIPKTELVKILHKVLKYCSKNNELKKKIVTEVSLWL